MATAALIATSTLLSGCGGSTSGSGDATGEDSVGATALPGAEESSDDTTETEPAEPEDTESEDTEPAEPETDPAETEDTEADAPSREDLDAYVAAGERSLDSILGPSLKKLYSSVDIEPVYPNGIEYVYVFRDAVDVARASKALKDQASVLRSSYRSQILPEMEGLGFEDPTVTWTYRNPDGTTIWTLTVP